MKIRKMESERFWQYELYMIILSCMLINVKLFSVASAAFKLIHVIMITGIIAALLRQIVMRKYLAWGTIFLILPLLPLYRVNDLQEWFKSYFIWTIMVLSFILCFPYWLEAFRLRAISYVRLFLNIILFVQILGIIQFVMMNVFGVHFLYNVFGNFQFQNNLYGIKSGFYRAYSLYYEPSVLGWVSCAGTAVLLMHSSRQIRHYWIYLLVGLMAELVTLSTSGLLLYLAIIVCKVLIMAKDYRYKILAVEAMVLVAVVLWNFTSVLDPLERIVSEYGVENTSGYERINTPFMYIEKVLLHYPLFGRGLGQEGMVDKIGRIGLYASVNNALLGVIVQFGLSAIIIYAPIVVYFSRKIRSNNIWWLPMLCLTGIYASTGSYVSLDTFLFVIILLLVSECLCGLETGGMNEGDHLVAKNVPVSRRLKNG